MSDMELDLPLDTSSPAPPVSEEALLDLPLRTEAENAEPPPAAAPRLSGDLSGEVAPLAPRAMSFAADSAVVLLRAAAAVLAATAGRGEAPRLTGLVWAGIFALYLSFFATVLPLLFFGKTVGMALTGLSARPVSEPPLRASECARRWLGTVLTAASAGIPLLFTRRNREAPSPADRLSGRALTVEG